MFHASCYHKGSVAVVAGVCLLLCLPIYTLRGGGGSGHCRSCLQPLVDPAAVTGGHFSSTLGGQPKIVRSVRNIV